MGPNPVWLAEALSERMRLEPGMRALDMGCGNALSSIFLAREFGVEVWAVDLWVKPAANIRRATEHGVGDRVHPIFAEAHALPFAGDFFDALVSFDAYHYFGTDDLYLGSYSRQVKVGGQIGIVVPGLAEELEDLPPRHLEPYWQWDFCSFHSPAWWRRHWAKTGLVTVEVADRLPAGWRDWLAWNEVCDRVNGSPGQGGGDASGRRWTIAWLHTGCSATHIIVDDLVTRWSTSLTSAAVAELVTLVRQQRPEIGDAPPVLIGEGISTLAYGLSAPAGGWVLRVSRQYPAPWTWRGGRRHEVSLAAELRRCGVPVPAEATVIEEVDGLPTAILERRVVGRQLTPDMVRADPQLTTRIATVLDRMHVLDIDDAVARGVPRDDPIIEFRQALAAVDLADSDLERRVKAGLELLESRTAIRVLCHRDFRLEHLIIADGGEVAGLLDLGEIGVDDPAVDLAFLHGELGAEAVTEICTAMQTGDPGLSTAAATIYSLWPLLELAPGGDLWGDPATARSRLEALV